MNSYLIESLAPLVFRAGKPFGSQASAQDVIFPLPSAGAGLVRYLHLSQHTDGKAFDWGKDKHEDYQKQVLSIAAKGPFLGRYDNKGKIEILVPKPANTMYFENKATGVKSLVRLTPKAFDGENELCGSDLPQNLLHVQMEQALQGKPAKGAIYWRLCDFINWQKGENLDFETVDEHGLTSVPTELRTHVAIDNESLSSADGMLFQTASFDLAHTKTGDAWNDKRLGFVVQTTKELKPDLATFGGERRLSHFKPVQNTSLSFEPTQQDVDTINRVKGFSWAFITPCIFGQGAFPAWIDKDTLTGIIPETSIQVTLKAMAIDRWDSVLWQPKATRRAVSAGSVYWFEITAGELDLQTLQQLSNKVWSDNEYDQNDGFGSAILSAWQAPKSDNS